MTATKAIPVKRLLSAQAYQLIDREIAKYPADQKQSAVMGALTIAQDEVGWVSPAVIEDVADYLSMPPIAVYEVATFYNMYNLEEVGTWKIGVCTCLPCALREGDKAGEYLKQKLGIDFGETTPDGRFTAMMPHPERVSRNIQMSWTPLDPSAPSPWMQMWRNARKWVG